MKRTTKTIALVLLSLGMLTGCNKSTTTTTYYGKDVKLTMDTDFKETGSYKIGILTPVTHGALDAARDGFIAELNSLGWVSGNNITFDIQNAQGDGTLLTTYADNLITSCDMVFGIGTGATQALKSAQFNHGTKKPILFTAVTDPVSADLIHTWDEPGGYVTGTSDTQPISDQIALIKECVPDITKVGIIYTQTEDNSKVQATQAAAACRNNGLTPIVATCTSKDDISAAASQVIDKGAQAIYLPTDNNIASAIVNVTSVANPSSVLVMCGEENMVTAGGHVTLSVDYTNLGKTTGDMANRILKGEVSPNQISVTSMAAASCEYVMSSVNLTYANITLPSSVLEAHAWRDINNEEN